MGLEAVAQGLSDLTNGSIDLTTAGFILGGAMTVAIYIALTWVLSDDTDFNLFASLGIGIILSVGFSWFPAWTVIFVAIIILYAVFIMRGDSGGGL